MKTAITGLFILGFICCFDSKSLADLNRDCDQIEGLMQIEAQLKNSTGVMTHEDLVQFFRTRDVKQYGYDFVHEQFGPILLTGAKNSSDGRNILSYHYEIGTRNIFFTGGYRVAPKDSPAGELLLRRWLLLRTPQ